MAFCYLLLTLLLLRVGVHGLEEQDIIEIDGGDEDSEDPGAGPSLSREPRQVREGSGGGWDYDDEDRVVGGRGEYGGPALVSSRTVPEASSPSWARDSVSPRTSRHDTPALSTARPGQDRMRGGGGARRPARLNSYYPDVRSAGEGSGGGEESFISTLGRYNDSELISPTRAHQFPPPGHVTSLQPGPGLATAPTNHEPFINSRLDKVPLTAGKSSRVLIPANTFQDLEDGDTRDLSLRVVDRDTGRDLQQLAWATFQPSTQEILALPTEENIGIYNLQVVATDSGGESTQDTLVVAVRQHHLSRTFHHEFTASLAMVEPDSWQHAMDWKLSALQSLVSFFGDPDPGRVTVIELAETSPGQVRFRWTNDSLPRQSCPKEDIIALYNTMTIYERPSQMFKQAFRGQFRVRDISLEYRGLCSVRHTDPATQAPAAVPGPAAGGYDNSMPQIRNPVDKLNVTAGELLQFQVPGDMCWDKEDGGTRDLNLQLLTLARLEVDSDNWLQFDVKNQEFVGVPLENDVGREEYQLVCSDNEGYSSIDGIEVSTLSRPFSEKFNVMFVFVFNDTLDDGTKLSRSRVRLLKKLARMFRDEDTRHIVLSKVDPVTMELAWYNKTFSARDCPVDNIVSARRFLLENDGSVRPRIVQAFEPTFHLSDIKMLMLGNCQELEAVPAPETTDDPIYDLLPPQEYIIAFVVPALIIVGMLLLAVLIACVLHKKRKAGKLDMFRTETLPPRIPVIMQDELCEDNFNMSKQPIILREEPESYNSYRPPNYYGSGRMEEEFSECESLVNGVTAGTMAQMGHPPHPHQGNGYHHTLPAHPHHAAPGAPYARPPPVALEFSDSLNRSRHRPAPGYRHRQQFNP